MRRLALQFQKVPLQSTLYLYLADPGCSKELNVSFFSIWHSNGINNLACSQTWTPEYIMYAFDMIYDAFPSENIGDVCWRLKALTGERIDTSGGNLEVDESWNSIVCIFCTLKEIGNENDRWGEDWWKPTCVLVLARTSLAGSYMMHLDCFFFAW